jgi:hypothetical protein
MAVEEAKYGCCIPAIAEILKTFANDEAEAWVLDFFKNSGVTLPPKCNPVAVQASADVVINNVPCAFIKVSGEGEPRD